MEVELNDVGNRWLQENLVVISIFIIIIVGCSGYFILMPSEENTITIFITYLSSLSTICLVIIYIFTDSRQLQIMKRQLEEMEFSRNIQSQPLPIIDNINGVFQLPQFYYGSRNDFKNLLLMCRHIFALKIRNYGNGPAISVYFFPSLKNIDRQSKKVETIIETFGTTVEYITLKEGDVKDETLDIRDFDNKLIELLVNKKIPFIEINMVYKNIIGMPYKEQISYSINYEDESDFNVLKNALKLIKTYNIDFNDDLIEYAKFIKQNNTDEAVKVMERCRAKRDEILGHIDTINFKMEILSGSFKVNPISEQEYNKILLRKKEQMEELGMKCIIQFVNI